MSESLYLHNLTKAVIAMHGPCQHERTALVHEMSEGEIVWKGNVETFALKGHPKASKAYAWAYDHGKGIQYAAVLNVPPINSPREAVQVWMILNRKRTNPPSV